MQHSYVPNLIQLEARYTDLLLREVYMEPQHYDRNKIVALLKEIKLAYPQRVPVIIRAAFERVVENSSMDQGTWLIDQFLVYGAIVDSVKHLRAALQDLEPYEVEPSCMAQVVEVVQRLLQVGANPGHYLASSDYLVVSDRPLLMKALVRAMGNIHDLAEIA